MIISCSLDNVSSNSCCYGNGYQMAMANLLSYSPMHFKKLVNKHTSSYIDSVSTIHLVNVMNVRKAIMVSKFEEA